MAFELIDEEVGGRPWHERKPFGGCSVLNHCYFQCMMHTTTIDHNKYKLFDLTSALCPINKSTNFYSM